MAHSEDQVSQLLKKTLDIHGYGFQYAVLKLADEMRRQNRSDWRLFGSESPVSIKNETTHIDFILKHRAGNTFIIAECKRADPAKANWCFVKSPYTWTDEKENYVQFDKIRWNNPSNGQISLRHHTALVATERNIAHIGVEVHTGEKGDGIGNPYKSAINQSVSQVLRSSSGFVNYFYNNFSEAEKRKPGMNDYRFLPVIFTTAQLWITNTDLGTANLQNGYLSNESVKAEKVEWLWFNENRSEPLSPDVKLCSLERDLTREYEQFVRSVAIVNAESIEKFFNTNFEGWLTMGDY